MFKKTPLNNLFGAILIGSMAAVSTPAMATNEAMLDLLKILRDKGNISAEEYELLSNASKADGEKVEGSINEMKAEVGKKTKDLPSINTKGKLELKKGDNKVRIGGRLQYDTTIVGTDGSYTDANGSSESQFRRARIYLSGTWAKYWDFKFQYDVEDTQDSDHAIEDAYIRYTGWPIHVTLGQRKSPFSMSELTSSKYIAFVERSFVSELFNASAWGVGNRNLGVTLTWNDMKNSGFLVEAGYTTNRQSGSTEGSIAESKIDAANGATGRIVWADYDKKARTLLHAGFSAGFRNYNGDIGRVRVRPNVSEGDRILDTGGLAGADSYVSYNVNVVGMYDRFWGNAEYFYGEVDLNTSLEGDDSMDGFIVQGGVFLTPGDNRRYKKGAWNSIKVKNPVHKGGMGAWEVALRYDSAELGAGIQSDDDASEEASAFTAALNWYPINNVRLQANYVKTFCDSGASGLCDWDSDNGESGEPDFFVIRAQTFF